MAAKGLLSLVAMVSLVLPSCIYGHSLSEPAAAVVPETTAAGAPLLHAERLQLTDAVLERLEEDEKAAKIINLLAFAENTTAQERGIAQCKTYPGDDGWPKKHVCDIFNIALGNDLIPTVPVAAPCYDSQWGPKNQEECNRIISNFGKAPIHLGDPTSVFWPIYQGRTCMAIKSTTASDECTLGGFPAYSVNVSNVAQIQLVVNFARTTNIRLVVKNTGQDYLVFACYNTRGYQGKAFKVGAGVTVEEIYRAAEAQGTTVQGGLCPSVGVAGGYLQGGGHNPLAGSYGMAVDSVLAYQVVLPSGRFVTASETSYPDLFWALRGGGPGTFGIVTSAIIKAHPKTDVTVTRFVLGNSTDGTQTVSREKFFKAVRRFWELFPTYTDANTYSFFFVFNTEGQLTLDMKNFFAVGHTPESLQELLAPWLETIEELGVPFKTPMTTTYYESFFPAYWYAWGLTPWPIGIATSLPGNRLVPRSSWTNPGKFETMWKTVVEHVEHARHFGV